MFKKTRNLLISITSPLSSLALLVFSSAPFMTFISVYMKTGGFSELTIGLTHSSFYTGYLIGSVWAEKPIKRIGYIRSFTAFASLYVATVMVQGLFLSATVWIIMRLTAGICISALYIVIESWLLVQSSDEKRGRTLSIYMLILYASQAFSQLLLTLIDIISLLPFLIFGLLGSISVIPVAITYKKSPELEESDVKKSISSL